MSWNAFIDWLNNLLEHNPPPSQLSMKKPTIQTYTIGITGQLNPPGGFKWTVLSGAIYHETGTKTTIAMYGNSPLGTFQFFNSNIPAATPSGSYPLFNTQALVDQEGSSGAPLILDWQDYITVAGGATAFLVIHVLEEPSER